MCLIGGCLASNNNKCYLAPSSPVRPLNPDALTTILSLLTYWNFLFSFIFGIAAILLGQAARKRDDIRNNVYVRWASALGWLNIIVPIGWIIIGFFLIPSNIG